MRNRIPGEIILSEDWKRPSVYGWKCVKILGGRNIQVFYKNGEVQNDVMTKGRFEEHLFNQNHLKYEDR